MRGKQWLGDLLQDLGFVVRQLWRHPGFTTVVALTIGVAIGANTAVFSVVNAMLLRPLTSRAPEELVVVANRTATRAAHGLSYPDYRDLREQTDSLDEMAAYLFGYMALSSQGATAARPERVMTSFVAGDFFSTLSVDARLGRVLGPGEGDDPGADPVVVLGHGLWERRFAGDPDVVGRVVKLNGQPFTIVGVVPKSFKGAFSMLEMDAYVPLRLASIASDFPSDLFDRRGYRELSVLARLKPGTSLPQAQAAVDVVSKRLQEQYPETNDELTIHLFPEKLSRPQPDSADAMPLVSTIFVGLVILVLLVSCFNVANLVLARANYRRTEIATRAALGAGRGRIIRQMLTESVAVTLVGCVLGLLIGFVATRVLSAMPIPGEMGLAFHLDLDWRVFSYIAFVALVSGILIGLMPAIRSSKPDLNDAISESGRAGMESGGRHLVRNAFVVMQIAGSLVLLIAAGLFIRSLLNAQDIELGFSTANLLNGALDPEELGYDPVRTETFYRDLERRLAALPDVRSVAMAHGIPLGTMHGSQIAELTIEGRDEEGTRRRPNPSVGYNIVGPGYFETLGGRIVRGREFGPEDRDSSRPVAVVNEAMARRFWPQEEALGQRFSLDGPEGPFYEVVGVAQDGKYFFVLDPATPYFYLPLEQVFESRRIVHLLTSSEPEALIGPLRRTVSELDPELPVFNVLTMEEHMQGANGFFLHRTAATLASVLGGVGLFLAIVGVYAVVSYSASRRTREIGIRMAMGAPRKTILKLVIRQGLVVVAVGLAVGLAAAVASMQFLGSLLYGVTPTDPVSFAGFSLLLAAVALVACFLPARRATAVDPSTALHYE